jgi:hypothetical protein
MRAHVCDCARDNRCGKLYGDGAITPPISVLSVLEDLKGPLPSVAPYVLPLSVIVLIAVFALQPQGTERIGALFGPVMTIWLSPSACLGSRASCAILACWPRSIRDRGPAPGFNGGDRDRACRGASRDYAIPRTERPCGAV